MSAQSPQLEALLKKAQTDPAFRKRLLENPVQVVSEHGFTVRDGVKLNVVEDTKETVYLVLPRVLDDELSVAELDSIAGGLCFGCF